MDEPSKSAVVLTLNDKSGFDGYLTVPEIAKLTLNADFVNLSACETGLGKVMNGEGVMGLTQGFLTAGANGLSVTLWQVNDRSTEDFMKGVYAKVKEKNLSFAEAFTLQKREFIQGNYSAPFFWAPFIYYGRK